MTGTSGVHAIDTMDDLRRHLQWAIELEHATIPPYLCALYSLDPDRNPDAVIEQGEGAAGTDVWDGDVDVFHPNREEVAHFYRFQELRLGRRYGAGDVPQTGPTGEEIKVDFDGVLPMRPNPRTADYPENSPIRSAQEQFNQTYSTLLYQLERSFNGHPSQIKDAVGTMYALRGQALALMKMPTGDGKTTAGPTFEYVPPGQRT